MRYRARYSYHLLNDDDDDDADRSQVGATMSKPLCTGFHPRPQVADAVAIQVADRWYQQSV